MSMVEERMPNAKKPRLKRTYPPTIPSNGPSPTNPNQPSQAIPVKQIVEHGNKSMAFS